MTSPEPATNWYATRRHYSADLAPNSLGHRGRQGHSLCSNPSNPVQVWDQEGVNGNAERYRIKTTTIVDLPECKKCARKVATADSGQVAQ